MGHPNFEDLVQVIEKLRDPKDGCPWDLKQTHSSLLRYLIEESYEFVHAVENKNDTEMEDEIGDVLLQVLLHSSIGKQRGVFNLESVSKNLMTKLIRRHPHVFDKKTKITSDEVRKNWEEIKNSEKEGKEDKSRISSSLNHLPALMAANKIGEKTNAIGFDWSHYTEVIKVVEDEWVELEDELKAKSIDQNRVEEEYGDLLFSMAQLGRHLNISPEKALHNANNKFIRRFQSMEQLIEHEDIKLEELTQDQMDNYWKKVKKEERK